MAEKKLEPVDIVIRLGADRAIAPTFTFLGGDDLTGWTAQFISTLSCGTILKDVTVPLLVAPLTTNVGTATVQLTSAETARMQVGKKQHYHFRLIDGSSRSDIYLYGSIDGYVVSGAR